MSLVNYHKHTFLDIQTTPPGIKRIPFNKPSPTPSEIPYEVSLPAEQHLPEPEENDSSLGLSTSEPKDIPSDHAEETQFFFSEEVNRLRQLARQRRRPARYNGYVTDF